MEMSPDEAATMAGETQEDHEQKHASKSQQSGRHHHRQHHRSQHQHQHRQRKRRKEGDDATTTTTTTKTSTSTNYLEDPRKRLGRDYERWQAGTVVVTPEGGLRLTVLRRIDDGHAGVVFKVRDDQGTIYALKARFVPPNPKPFFSFFCCFFPSN